MIIRNMSRNLPTSPHERLLSSSGPILKNDYADHKRHHSLELVLKNALSRFLSGFRYVKRLFQPIQSSLGLPDTSTSDVSH